MPRYYKNFHEFIKYLLTVCLNWHPHVVILYLLSFNLQLYPPLLLTYLLMHQVVCRELPRVCALLNDPCVSSVFYGPWLELSCTMC